MIQNTKKKFKVVDVGKISKFLSVRFKMRGSTDMIITYFVQYDYRPRDLLWVTLLCCNTANSIVLRHNKWIVDRPITKVMKFVAGYCGNGESSSLSSHICCCCWWWWLLTLGHSSSNVLLKVIFGFKAVFWSCLVQTWRPSCEYHACDKWILLSAFQINEMFVYLFLDQLIKSTFVYYFVLFTIFGYGWLARFEY